MKKSEMTFEEKMNRLEEILNELNNDKLSLDEGLKLYEESRSLIEDLDKTLLEAKNKVENREK